MRMPLYYEKKLASIVSCFDEGLYSTSNEIKYLVIFCQF